MDKFRIYYCIDINLWYIDKDDGFIRTTQTPQEIFDFENDAVNFFLRLHDSFLDAQKYMLINAGQKSTASETKCYLQTSNLFYTIEQNGTWTCKSLKSE